MKNKVNNAALEKQPNEYEQPKIQKEKIKPVAKAVEADTDIFA